MPLPHIQNSAAGRNKWDPVFKAIFEQIITVPEAIREEFGKDEMLISEHVLNVSGLDGLLVAPGVSQQKFMGTDRSYINPVNDQTHVEFEVTYSLNLRNRTDNYVLRFFRAWSKLGYDISTGARSLKVDYCAPWMQFNVANQAGDIHRQIILKDVMMNGPISGLDSLDYTSNDASEITVKFVSDWFDDTDAK